MEGEGHLFKAGNYLFPLLKKRRIVMPARNEKKKKKISLKEGKYKRHMFIIQTYKVQRSVNYGLHTKISIILVIHPYPSSQMYNDNP